MTIEITLDKDFERFLDQMREKYGEQFEYINGVHPSQLNYSVFMDKFKETTNMADVSSDPNANARNKDLRSFITEKNKPYDKLFGLSKTFLEVKKKWGLRTAKAWFEQEYSRGFYLNDASASSSYFPYCYKGEERLNVLYCGELLNVSMSELYSLVEGDCNPVFDEKLGQIVYYPENLYVEDFVDGEVTFETKIERIVKHKNSKRMRFIKMSNGLSQIVTENHPVITHRGDIEAKNVQIGDKVTTFSGNKNFTNELHSLIFPSRTKGYRYDNTTSELPLNKDIGWVVGLFVAEGCASNGAVWICQLIDSPYTERLLTILDATGYSYTVQKELNRVYFNKSPLKDWLQLNFRGKTSRNKCLPPEFVRYSFEFLDGIVSGIIDGDGTIDGEHRTHCQIRVASETLCHQIHSYLSSKELIAGDRIPYVQRENDYSFKSESTIYGVGFSINDDYFRGIGSIKIDTRYIQPSADYNSSNKRYTFTYGEASVIENVDLGYICEDVFDITTSTGHFICNNILSHNCYAVDLTKLATEGLFYLHDYNAEAPEHLTTFLDDIIEFVSFLSNRQSGAVGLPNIIIWSYYFWKKDCETGNYIKSPDYYLRQCFQKLIYRLNQPFLRIDQSAFTNVSIFDRKYIEGLFGGVVFPDGTMVIDEVEEIVNCQKVFMEVVAEIRHQQMFTFPVLTYSLLYKDGKFQDEDFARWCSDHNVEWQDSNFFISDNVGVLSNCCFDGNQEFYYYDKDGNKYLTTFKDYVESRLNKHYHGSQVIDTVMDEYIDAPDGTKQRVLAVSKLPNTHKKLIEIELDDGRMFRVTPEQKFFDYNSNTLVTASELLKTPERFDI